MNYWFKFMGDRKNINEFKIANKDNIIALCVFGSYNTDFWMENRSDIDILALLNERRGISFEFELEDELNPKLEEFFSYKNIHITFLYLNEFDSNLAEKYIESTNKLVIDIEKEIDFRLYVNKYLRNNEWLDRILKEDTKLMKGK